MKTTFGISMTIAWAVAMATILWLEWPADGMELNKWGDFFAGLTAPIAFLWLIIGYFQQGAELKQNTRALNMQAEELRLQVKETGALVEQSARQAEAATEMLELERQQLKAAEERERARLLPRF